MKANVYFNLKVHLDVLCANIIIANKPPGQPPIAPSATSESSDTRRLEPHALHLSKPNARKVKALKAENQTAANVLIMLKRRLSLPYPNEIGMPKRH